MKKGKVLKVRFGHDANCSSEAYIGLAVVMYGAYGVLTGILIGVQAALRSKRWANRMDIAAIRRLWWIIPQLIALGIVIFLSIYSGSFDYGAGIMCFMPFMILILIFTLVGAKMVGRVGGKTKRKASVSPSMLVEEDQ